MNSTSSGNAKPFHNRFTFTKAERLHRDKLIEELFDRGQSVTSGPIRIVYLEKKPEGNYPAQVLVSVPKKNFPKAADRNRIKRLLREAYRMNKQPFYEALVARGTGMILAVLYQSKKTEPLEVLQDKLVTTLKKIVSGG